MFGASIARVRVVVGIMSDDVGTYNTVVLHDNNNNKKN
jgi:hypothetical protein